MEKQDFSNSIKLSIGFLNSAVSEIKSVYVLADSRQKINSLKLTVDEIHWLTKRLNHLITY